MKYSENKKIIDAVNKNVKVIATFNKNDREAISKCIKSFRPDVYYKYRLGKILLGSVHESCNWVCSYNSDTATITINYHFTIFVPSDDLIYKTLTLLEAEEYIKKQIPVTCRPYVKCKKTIIE